MITSYQIKKLSQDEECLVLYISMQEEFSLEWFQKLKKDGFKEFIKNHRIFWNGTKVFLVIGGITLAVLNYNPTETIDKTYTYVSNPLFSPVIEEIISEPEKEENIIIEDQTESETYITNNSELSNSTPEEPSITPVTPTTPSSETPSNSTSSEVTSKPAVEEIPKEEPTPEAEQTIYITVYRSSGEVVTLSLKDYLIGVVAAEMPASFQIESLKAQSILARTYALKAIDSGKKLTDTVSTQRYIDTKEMQNIWGSSYQTYYNKIKRAVTETEDLVVTYQGTLIDAVYHSTSNGATEDSENVWGNAFPYLKSVSSHWDKSVSSYTSHKELTKQEFSNIFGLDDTTYNVEILERNRSGRVSFIRIGTKTYSGVEVRTKLGLRSTDFDISLEDNSVKITTRGYGHGVGMSQYGANEMAKEGRSYKEILHHYYTGIEIVSMF